MKRPSLLSPLLLSLCLLAGCSGNSQSSDAPSFGEEGPLYVVSTGVSSGDDFVGYLAVVNSLDRGTSFDLNRGLEIEASWIFGQPGRPYVYAASLFSPTITRYDLHEDGTFTAGDTLSFANYGVQSPYLAASAPIFSDEKSYFVDDVQDQMIIWNPSRMEVIGAIPFGDELEDGLPPAPEGSVVEHDGLLLTTVDWSDWMTDSSTYGSHTRLIAIDPETDTIVGSTDDDRLTFASPVGESSDGAHYYSSGALIAAYSEIGAGRGSPSHVIRVQPSETSFDDAYLLDLESLTGGRPAGDFTWLDDETAVFRVWHPELVDPVTPAAWEDVLWSQAGFLWWRWHVGDAEATPIPNQEPGTLGSSLVHLDGKTYVIRTAADATSSTLDEITLDGEMRAGVTGPGQFIGNAVVRLR